MTANFMVILMGACGCALLRVVIVHHETRMDDSRYPTEQRQNDAKKETSDASGHQHSKRRKYHAEKIAERFHNLVTRHQSLVTLFQFVIFDHRIRQQIATKLVQPRFKLAVLPFDLDLHVFPDSNAAHFRHSQMAHRVTHRVSLRIQHGGLWHHDHPGVHHRTILRRSAATSAIAAIYFKTTTSRMPFRRRTFTPTSPSSCLVSRRSTLASPTFRPRMPTCGRNCGKNGFENTSFRSGANTSRPRHASSKRNTAPEAHACGAQATGYKVGDSPGRRGKPQNSSGRRCKSKKMLACIKPASTMAADPLSSYLAKPAAIRELSCGQIEPL